MKTHDGRVSAAAVARASSTSRSSWLRHRASTATDTEYLHVNAEQPANNGLREGVMRAVVYRSVGAPEVIEVAEVDLPEPGLFEIRVKVDAAGLNPADVAAWSGLFPAPPDGSHFGLGWDVAGTVDAVGPAAAWEIGTPVIAIVQGATGMVRAQGEYAIVPSNAIAIAPAGVDAAHAATIPLSGLTAAQSVELLGLSAGQSVFITGAAGAVGGYAVQLAKRRGLTVIASDSADDDDFVTRVLGADAFVSASDDPTPAVRQIFPNGVDAVLDTTTLGGRIIGAVADGGTFVTTRVDALPQPERGIRVRLTQVSPDAAMLTTLSDLASTGALALRVAQIYPLEQAAQAHARLAEGGLRGRLVLTTP
jgi:NADPH:quinone reductase-like Zn-dependent oxidoreductase